jgi:multiple sugar transport system ATP-binding protein
MFVAGFIGSPAMNFYDAAVTGSRDELVLDAGSFKLPVPAARREKLEPFVGKNVIIGVRPEDIHDREYVPGALNGAPVPAQVDVIEPMGSEIYLYLLSGLHSYIARVDPRSKARPGNRVEVMMNLDHLHVFDKETERAII